MECYPGSVRFVQVASMYLDLITFRVSQLAATVPEGVSIEWQGREFNSGPLAIELDEDGPASIGLLDYSRDRAQADFHVRLAFPELASLLEALGVDPDMT